MIQPIIIISAIFTLVGVFVIAYVLYFNKRKSSLLAEKKAIKEEYEQQLLKSRIEIQELTYQQIGKELHDNVGQLLSTSRMLLGLTERALNSPPDTLLTANATLGTAINELRSLSKSLDKEWLEQFNFVENLNTEIARINAGNTLSIRFSYDHQLDLNADQQIILFRIVQEAIQNAIKHAYPESISISAIHDEGLLYISVIDDGKGFEAGMHSPGMGLSNMKHRCQLLGGTINWTSHEGKGTVINISIPINHS